MKLYDGEIRNVPKEIHLSIVFAVIIIIKICRKIISVRILRENLQSMISVGELFARNFPFPIYAESSTEWKLAIGKQIFRALVPNFSEGIFYGFAVSKNTDFYTGAPVFNSL